jgi:hypothetical protein
MGASGTTTIDFGAFPGASDASVVVTGQTGIGAGSILEAWIFPNVSADHSADEHMVETIRAFADASTIVAGVGFTIRAFNTSQLNEPLETAGPSRFRSAAASVYGYVSPSVGGMGTRIYGIWNVAWVWV